MNSTFGNIDELMAGYGPPTLQLHPRRRGPRSPPTASVQVWNRRGSMLATMRLERKHPAGRRDPS